MEPARGPLPTFRLYVGHAQPFESLRDESELRRLLERHARVARFVTRPGWRHSFVTFASTADAVRVKAALDGQPFRGRALVVSFARPTTRLIVRALPSDVGVGEAATIFRGASGAERDGQDVALVFKSG